jgi:hypothetical protein
MMKRQPSLLLILVAIGLLLACSKSGEAEGPGGVVQQFYDQLNSGNYSAAKEMYNAEARATLNDPEVSSAAGFRTWANTQTKDRTISRVEIIESASDETGATVDYEIQYRDGSAKRGQVRLTQEEGEWKLGFSLDLSS